MNSARDWFAILLALAGFATSARSNAGDAQKASEPTAGSKSALRVFLRGGPKTHGPGEHDHPRFVAEWKPLLEARGAQVQGELRFPTADELARTDVLVLYAADGASIHGDERTRFESFLARGGGLVVLHDAVCGDDPHWFQTIAGGAWEWGKTQYQTGVVDLYTADAAHAITRGAANFHFDDELYWNLDLEPDIHVLQSGFPTVFDITPQMWTFEKANHRAFVSLQGHREESFEHAAWRTLLLRGIAWAARRDVELLLKPGEAEALAYPVGGPTRPEQASKSLSLHPDFELTLVAAEPLIEKPISLDWDARGRLWVAQSPGYPEKERFSRRPARDEIAILSDNDGDGRMDAKQVFAGGLDLVTSLVFHRDGVIVSAAPEILWLRDKDRDGVCETREVLFQGFGFGDTHAVLSNLRWGIDGWIYATQGYSGNESRHVRNAAGRDFGAIGNGILRFKPDGTAIEMVSSYGSNTWGLDFTSDGELLFSMANGAHLRHVVVSERVLAGGRVGGVESWTDVPDHDRVVPLLEHHDAPYAQIDFVGGFTATSGCCVYDGGAWPAEWNDTCFVAEPTVHLVHHDVLARRGVTFTASKARDAEFLAGTDPWFRPIHMRIGPDGALYVLDFYNQAVVHNDTRGPKHGPTNFALRPDRDHEHGRIWRVQHRRARELDAPSLANAGPDALAAALASPNGWTRATAQRMLIERGVVAALPRVEELASRGATPAARIQAAWCLRHLADIERFLPALLADRDAGVRKNAARIAALELVQQPDSPLKQRVIEMLEDRDAQVRLSALVALENRRAAPDELWRLLSCWSQLEDDASRSALVRVAALDWIGVIEATFDARWADVQGARGTAQDFATLVSELARYAARSKNCVGALQILRALKSAPREESACVVAALKVIGEELPSSAVCPVDAQVHTALAALLGSESRDVARAALPLARRWESQGSLEAAHALAARLAAELGSDAAPSRERIADLEALLSGGEVDEATWRGAARLLAATTALEEQRSIVAALDRAGMSARATTVVLGAWSSLSPAARDLAFDACLRRAPSSSALLDALEHKQLALADLGPQRQHRLRTHPDASIAARAAELFTQLGAQPSAKVDELVTRFLPIASQPGDAAAGKLVFEKNCVQCHAVDGVGGRIGPDLTGMGTHGARELLPIVLDPNRAVEAAFAEWQLETKDGKLVSGILAREDARSLVLRSTAGDVEVARDEIEWLRNTGRSPMPEGLDSIGAEGLRDLFAYLTGKFAGWRVLDLENVVSSSSLEGLYDVERDKKPLVFAHYGINDVDGVPFELLDPRQETSGCNALVLKGGWAGWDAKEKKPKRVEIAVGCALQRVHVLGGVGGWAYPFHPDARPICTWTWVYEDGQREDVVLKSGVEFSDWIARNDVSGSEFVDGLLTPDSFGQVRRFALEPRRKDAIVRSIVLESPDGEQAATFFALTAELAGAVKPSKASETASTPPRAAEPVEWLIVGGGTSHDFRPWFEAADLKTLAQAKVARARYTERLDEIGAHLDRLRVLELCTNQPLTDTGLRHGIFDFVARGGSLLVLHPANWFNWPDWPEYNARLVGGGSRGHGPFGEFEVRIVDPAHPLASSLPPTFRIEDELYRFEPDANGSPIHVIALGRSLDGKEQFPVVWTVERDRGRTACITLGHDGRAHQLPEFRQLLTNTATWLLEPSTPR